MKIRLANLRTENGISEFLFEGTLEELRSPTMQSFLIELRLIPQPEEWGLVPLSWWQSIQQNLEGFEG